MFTRRVDDASRIKLQVLERRRGAIARQISKVDREIRQLAGRALAKRVQPTRATT